MDPARKRLFILIGSIASVAIGLAAIGIPLAISMGTTTSSDGTLTVTDLAGNTDAGEDSALDSAAATVIGSLSNSIFDDPSDAIFWLIPVDAPMSTFPAGDLCSSQQQRNWLAEHAKPYRLEVNPVQARVHNSADSGASLALTNVRLDGEWLEVTRTVLLTCIGIGDNGTQSIRLHADGSPGTWSQWYGWEENAQPEGSIATLNLAPGEVANLNFELPRADRDFVGRVVADMVGVDDAVVVLAENVSFSAHPLDDYSFLFPETETVMCSWPDGDTSCTYAEAEEFLREAGRQAAR